MVKNIIIIYGSGASYDSGYQILGDKEPFLDINFFGSLKKSGINLASNILH